MIEYQNGGGVVKRLESPSPRIDRTFFESYSHAGYMPRHCRTCNISFADVSGCPLCAARRELSRAAGGGILQRPPSARALTWFALLAGSAVLAAAWMLWRAFSC